MVRSTGQLGPPLRAVGTESPVAYRQDSGNWTGCPRFRCRRARCRDGRRRILEAIGALRAVSNYTRSRRDGASLAGLRVEGGRRRRTLRVRARRRPELQLAGPRPWTRLVRNAKHVGDGRRDDSERDVLVARAGGDEVGRGVRVERAAAHSQAVDVGAQAAFAVERSGDPISDYASGAAVVTGSVRGEVSRLPRNRS